MLRNKGKIEVMFHNVYINHNEKKWGKENIKGKLANYFPEL